jgi:peptidoglycan/xylan/chitin deacetylase (PgdA/CDA1 family)
MPAATGGREAARAVLAVALRPIARPSARRAGLVLAYHRVGGERRDPSLEIDPAVPIDAFERHLKHLSRHYRVVPAADIVRAARERRRGQRFPVAITFDDDLRSHVRAALPVLGRVGLGATFFLCGSSLHEPHPPWWNDLQHAVDNRLVQPDGLPHVPEADVRPALERSPLAIRRVASLIERLEPAQRDEVALALRTAVGTSRAEGGLRARDVEAIVAGGFDVGFHTLRHDALPPLSDAALEEAMARGREALAVAAGRHLELIAYPHGKADARVAEVARETGFSFGFTTSPGLVGMDTNPLLIPRIVPALSAGAFALQLARAFAG